MVDTLTGWRFLTDADYATKLTPAGGMPTRNSQPDEVAIWHLANRTLLVDTDAGVITKIDGISRVERHKANGYGHVFLGRVEGHVRFAYAHRIVWIARYGPIPGMYTIAHRNQRHWDNRIENLALITRAERAFISRGSLHLGSDDDGPDDRPAIQPYATMINHGLVPSRVKKRLLD